MSAEMSHSVVFCLILIQALIGAGLGSSCRSSEDDPWLLFSTLTSYDVVRETQAGEENVQGCEAVQFYLMARHGSRYDSADYIRKMNQQLPPIRDRILESTAEGDLCNQDVEALRSWSMRMEESKGYYMADSGLQEMKDIASRFKTRFPSLLGESYSAEKFHFQNTQTGPDERTRRSAEAYAEGLFGSHDGITFTQVPEKEDTLLRPNKICKKYIQTVGSKPVDEQNRFKSGQEVADMLQRVNTRLGFQNDTLQYDTLWLIFRACSFEYAVYGDSPWCAVFSSDDFQVMTYAFDLFFYYREGYGHSINKDMYCGSIVDIVEQFRSAMEDQNPLAVQRFAHHGNIHGMIMRLGLFKDPDPLTAETFTPASPKLWNPSETTPQAANIAIVLFKCGEEHKIKVYLNEKVIKLPSCQDELCSLDNFWDTWQSEAEDCDLENLCQEVSQATTIKDGGMWILMMALYFLSLFYW